MRQFIKFLGLAATLCVVGCSDDENNGGSGGSAGEGGNGGSGGSSNDAGPTAVSMSGTVVDGSTGTGFGASGYTELSGVKVCVEGNTGISCATTGADGKYTIELSPMTGYVLTYEKDGYFPIRFAINTPAQDGPVQMIIMPSTPQTEQYLTDVGVTQDGTLGTIFFGAITPSTDTSAMFYQEFGGMGFEYVEGYTVTISPAADNGPFYTGTDWSPDPSLTESSAAGWGTFITKAGTYTLTFNHPTLACGMTTTTVVAGFGTTYVGTACAQPVDAGP